MICIILNNITGMTNQKNNKNPKRPSISSEWNAEEDKRKWDQEAAAFDHSEKFKKIRSILDKTLKQEKDEPQPTPPKAQEVMPPKPFIRTRPLDYTTPVRNTTISFRVSAKEYDSIVLKAAKCRVPVSKYVRNTVVASVPRQALSDEERILYTEVRSVINDCQQMSNFFRQRLTEKDDVGKEKYERKIWESLQVVLKKLKSILKV